LSIIPARSTVTPVQTPARFVTGSVMRHVVVMTATGTAGVVAIFLVDMLSLLYISWLGDATLTAGVGLATILVFIATSINVGLMIAVGALVARRLGARQPEEGRRIATSAVIWSFVTAGLATALLMPSAGFILDLMGARGEVHAVALHYCLIVLPGNLTMAVGMACSGILRATGDARRAMNLTLIGAGFTAILDPILIFGLGLGVTGAAIGMLTSRFLFAVIGLYFVQRHHAMLARPRLTHLLGHARPVFAVAVPAILTSVASPVAMAFLAGVIARFGAEAIAGSAVIERITPVAFGGLFALSGAVGPILGQNWGAERFDRMRATLRDAMRVTALYVMVTWALLMLGRDLIVTVFDASGDAAALVAFFCLVAGPIWFFNGLLFVANASFNNLGFPFYATAFNWGRATLGTMPPALAGASIAGPHGAILGAGMGSVLFGTLAIATAFHTLSRLERVGAGPPETARKGVTNRQPRG